MTGIDYGNGLTNIDHESGTVMNICDHCSEESILCDVLTYRVWDFESEGSYTELNLCEFCVQDLQEDGFVVEGI